MTDQAEVPAPTEAEVDAKPHDLKEEEPTDDKKKERRTENLISIP